MRTSIKIFLPILLSVTFINCELFEFLTGDLKENDNCVLSENVNGTCLKISNCRHEHERYRRRETTLKICQLNESDNNAFICCPPKIDLDTRFDENLFTKNYDDDYFDNTICRNRHLNLRRKNSIESRIFHGNNVERNEWQNIAAIGWTQYDESIQFTCGGVIISEWFIITAASCRTVNKFPDTVRVGDRFLSSSQDNWHAQQLKIEKFIQHPDYRFFKVYHDIAVVKTVGKILLNEFVAPACIGDTNDGFSQVKIAGFGQADPRYFSNIKVLSEIPVKIYDCYRYYRYRYDEISDGITVNQFCTKGREYYRGIYEDACHGDIGGPIQYQFNYQFNTENETIIYKIPVLIGIISLAQCGNNNLPSINTRISPYREWILSVMNELDTSRNFAFNQNNAMLDDSMDITTLSTVTSTTTVEETTKTEIRTSTTEPTTTTTLSTTSEEPFTQPPAELNKNKTFPDDYFELEVCRERYLILRKSKKNAADLLREIEAKTRFLDDEECNEGEIVDCVNGTVDPFYNILHGTEVKEFDWSFIAAIGWTHDDESVKYLCGGVILSNRFIATAAHCRGKKSFPDTVRVGDRYLKTSQDDNHAQQLNVERFLFHSDYTNLKRYHDIAVIKTSEEIKFNNYVSPACLADVMDEEMKLKIAGYGKTDIADNKPSTILHEITVNVFPIEMCNDSFDGHGSVPNGILPSQFCVLSNADSKGNMPDACQGDSGGPVQYTYKYNLKDANYEQTKLRTVYDIPMAVGVVSFGIECGLNVPSVNTRISYYNKWILCAMNELIVSTNTTAENCK